LANKCQFGTTMCVKDDASTSNRNAPGISSNVNCRRRNDDDDDGVVGGRYARRQPSRSTRMRTPASMCAPCADIQPSKRSSVSRLAFAPSLSMSVANGDAVCVVAATCTATTTLLQMKKATTAHIAKLAVRRIV
jgi:hypothetical protein